VSLECSPYRERLQADYCLQHHGLVHKDEDLPCTQINGERYPTGPQRDEGRVQIPPRGLIPNGSVAEARVSFY
jgi:hypothetical protein